MARRAPPKRTRKAPSNADQIERLENLAASSRKRDTAQSADPTPPVKPTISSSRASHEVTRFETYFRLPKVDMQTVQEIGARLGKPDSYILKALEKQVKATLADLVISVEWPFKTEDLTAVTHLPPSATVPFFRQSIALDPSQVAQLHDTADDPLTAHDTKDILRALAILVARDHLVRFSQKSKTVR